jgi:hypothetical protein
VPFSPAALTRRSANDAILALIIHRWTHENWLEQHRYLNVDDLREPKPNEHLCAETRYHIGVEDDHVSKEGGAPTHSS